MRTAADTPTDARIGSGTGRIRVGRVVGGRTATMTVAPTGTTTATGIAAASVTRTAAAGTPIATIAAAGIRTVVRTATAIGGIAGTVSVTGIAAASAMRTAADTPTDATTGTPTLLAGDVIRLCRIRCPKRTSMPSRDVGSPPFQKKTRNVLRVTLFTPDRCSTLTLNCLMSMPRRPIAALRAWMWCAKPSVSRPT